MLRDRIAKSHSCFVAAVLLVVCSSTAAQVTLDGTLGTSGALAGPHYAIPSGVGKQVGGNLFHSFGRFSIYNGESATFSGPASVSNVISRVTGGYSSTIDGLLRSTISGANLFLINPKGVVFGPNASLDVSGSFHASSADYLALGTSGRFDASNPAATILTSAPPSAFGFLSPAPRAVEVNGSFLVTAPGKTLSLVGGTVSITDAGLLARAGNINVASVAGPGEARLAENQVALAADVGRGAIEIKNSFALAGSDSGLPAGKVVIRGGTLRLADSFISSRNTEAGQGGGVAIDVTGELSMRGGFIRTGAESTGAAGNIDIQGGVVSLGEGAQVVSIADSTGAGGAVSILARESIRFSNDAFVLSATSDAAGGDVAITAPVLEMRNGHVLSLTSGAGTGGAIDLKAHTLTLRDGAQLSSGSSGSGSGGNVVVSATETLGISGKSVAGFFSGIFSTAAGVGNGGAISITANLFEMNDGIVRAATNESGAGGSLTVEARRVTLAGGAELASQARGAGRGGNVNLTARDSIVIEGEGGGSATSLNANTRGSGDAGHIFIQSPLLTVRDGALINAGTTGDGDGGDITIDAGTIGITDRGKVLADSLSTGRGGSIVIRAGEALTLSDAGAGNLFDTYITTEALSAGNAGNISIAAPVVTADHAFISSRAQGSGAAGNINVNVTQMALTRNAQINSATTGSGPGGALSITASDLLAMDDSLIFANTQGTGAGGNIAIRANRVSMTNGAQIDSGSAGAGDGGALSIAASESVSMSGIGAKGLLTRIFATAEGSGRGGNISVTAPLMSLDAGGIDARSTGAGAAGNINIEGNRIALTGGFAIFASADGTGPGGTLTVTAAESLTISGKDADGAVSGLNTRSTGSGRGGDIVIRTPALSMDDGLIRSRASATGAAGNISIEAGRVTIAGGALVDAGTTGAGVGGSLNVTASESVTLTGGSVISATSTGTGNAGSIAIDAGASLRLNGSSITTQADIADGGNIHIKAVTLVHLKNSQITTSVGTGSGNGGNITIDPTFVILDGSRISANAFGGNGGNILIVTDALIKSGDSEITASSQLGVQGTITITAPESDLSGRLRTLPGALFDPSLLMRESCSARAARAGSSFIGVGHGGVPDRPGALAFSSYADTPATARSEQRAPAFALAEAFGGSCFR